MRFANRQLSLGVGFAVLIILGAPACASRVPDVPSFEGAQVQRILGRCGASMTMPIGMFLFTAVYLERCRGDLLQNADVERIGHRGGWLQHLPPSADVWFAEPMFDDATYLRVDLTTLAEARAVFDRLADESGTRHDTYNPPPLWPVHPDTTESPFGFPVPPWWPAIGTSADVWLVQNPATLGECVTRNVGGSVVMMRGRRVYAHAWWREYVGGCGG